MTELQERLEQALQANKVLQSYVDGYRTERDEAEAQAQVLREALERHHRWHLAQTEADEYGLIPAGSYVEAELCEITIAALATAPGEAVAKLLADERERCCAAICPHCAAGEGVYPERRPSVDRWTHEYSGWCFASDIRALPATPATESEGHNPKTFRSGTESMHAELDELLATPERADG
jgi:hypothetical protein